eukprot:5043971-Pleurochrysis_carterae.AAC.1
MARANTGANAGVGAKYMTKTRPKKEVAAAGGGGAGVGGGGGNDVGGGGDGMVLVSSALEARLAKLEEQMGAEVPQLKQRVA